METGEFVRKRDRGGDGGGEEERSRLRISIEKDERGVHWARFWSKGRERWRDCDVLCIQAAGQDVVAVKTKVGGITVRETAVLKAPAVKIATVETAAAEIEAVETGAMETAALDTAAVESAIVDTAAVETGVVETAVVDTAAVETATVDTTVVKTAGVETPTVETAGVETAAVETAVAADEEAPKQVKMVRSQLPEVGIFHFKGEKVSEWLELMEQILVEAKEADNFFRMLNARNRHTPGSFTIEESKEERRRIKWKEAGEEEPPETLSISLANISEAMEMVSTFGMAGTETITALREKVMENLMEGGVELVYRL
ncbi:hypothetical protein CBR_g50155 [Chara braunii]|uniref:Uncharacterized protein n=1 Tax=Chara braunii TaxID=69332 RepID=A0A388M6G6_CHABU|nr:hypothetical protein CBR_g50155 [Chara braunii]|eukprot:GBG90062.1 hypothetical protein CBR_g50155 [Chara braunii]